jgi:XRE family transcriptional regulator, regulator of sulfur utilization
MDATELNQRLGRRVRARRLGAGLSLGDLARASGLSKTILAKIESGAGNPSVETLYRLSQALAVPFGALLEGGDAPRTRSIPHRSGHPLRADSGMSSWVVHADGRDRRTELHELSFAAGVEHRSEPHLPGTEEVVFCLEGRLAVGPEGEASELQAGDALWFVADVPHAYRALGGDARALNYILYPGGAG